MRNNAFKSLASAAALVLAFGFVSTASAAPRLHKGGVTYARSGHGRYQPLVSDGQGTGFGFHRLPLPYSVAAVEHHDRQSDAVRSAVAASALDSQPFSYGQFYGDSVYGAGNAAAYGVFNGADGYGTPYFAGYYGPADGTDLGPLGRTYAN